ncbi:cysteine-rich CWC family protein [Ottowia caeni]|uniref:cysteine-rich CWC family protein n=1 Tax=Ottowia caeni TaxID=2870339 RepID=UPI001E47153D|nr:cysteine-rich CWC family protein [Ottowia caeni]
MPFEFVDPTRCPLCNAPNQCAAELAVVTSQPQAPCWCMKININNKLLDQIPPESRGKACICRTCAAKGSE